MDKLKIVYSQEYDVDIGRHVFPTNKYTLIYGRMVREGLISERDIVHPDPAPEEDILLVHDKDYVRKLKEGGLSREEEFRLELPYSKELVRASYICVGGTILSCDIALDKGIGIHIGGGFHHAFSDHGEGFCLFNDIAIAIKKMKKDSRVKRAMVIDCDLHQGNGTADIFKDDPRTFTFSIHQEHNYPFFKPKSDLDIGLEDYTQDKEYLRKLSDCVPKIISDFKPEMIVYVAGADPFERDVIGNLRLTKKGLQKRDEFILETAKNYAIPTAVVLAGGYAEDINDTVSIHLNTVKTALNYAS
ncbi:MAG: histone deacetylase [Candidatus Omnitrophica bacterium]|nr:histone deacetylase [Candidatus Omnitrophota bacterium]